MNLRLVNRLAATLTLPSTVSLRRVPLSVNVPVVANAHGEGSIVVGSSKLQARQISLSGSIYYPSRQVIRETADMLLQFLQHPPIEVYKWPDRHLIAYPLGVPQDWMDAGAELGVDISMLVPDPYYYGAESVVDITSPIDVDGTAPTHPVITVEVTAAGGDITITNTLTGRTLTVVGMWEPGDIVTVDTAQCEASLVRGATETRINDRLSDDFVAYGLELLPGSNGIDYAGPAATVSVAYRPRWY